MNSQVNIGAVRTFDHVKPNKEQALKPLEEAAEVFAAWQVWNEIKDQNFSIFYDGKEEILSECADVIQSVCNLAASLGVHDLTHYMHVCEQRNRERGRFGGDDNAN